MKLFTIILIILTFPSLLTAGSKVLCNYTEENHLSPDGYTRYNLICSGDIIINKGNQTKFYMKYGRAVFDQTNADGQIVPKVSGYVEPILITRRKEKVVINLPLPEVITIRPVNVKVRVPLPLEEVIEDTPDDDDYVTIPSGYSVGTVRVKRHKF